MATNVTRDWVSVDAISDAKQQIINYDEMIKNVLNMLNTEGPIYTTWIRFQIGKSNPITFNTASQDETQNIIADLEVTKSGVGVANSFRLNVIYDPFNYGQQPSDKIELLDDLVANAMSFDITDEYTESDGLDSLRGYIQYGYNCATDTKLVSPKYEFLLTNATSTIKMDTGKVTYTFEGSSDLAMDCDFTVPFPAIENLNLMEVITTVLYCYYGDDTHKPDHVLDFITPVENHYKYRISIDESLYTNAQTITYAATSEMSPWQYCKELFDMYISQPDTQKEEYSDLTKIKSSERPYYQMYLTDIAGNKTITVSYISPLSDDNLSLDYEFTWGLEKQSLVQEWVPQVDLQLYLIRKAKALRDARLEAVNPTGSSVKDTLDSLGINWWGSFFNNLINTDVEIGDGVLSNWLEDLINGGAQTIGNIGKDILDSLRGIDTASIQAFLDKFHENARIVEEMYDATLTTIGIPGDIPVTCEIRIKPRVLSSVSRTAGIYKVVSCTDKISSGGTFTSTIQLFRLRALD